MNVHSTPRRPHNDGNPRATPVAVRGLRGTVAFVALVVLLGGVPWALTRYIGWPLPDHVPTWAELQATLAAPLNTSLLLNILAVLCWLAWAVFLVDVIRAVRVAVRAALRGVPHPTVVVRSGPVHAFAATLVTAVAVALLAYRPLLDSSTATAVPVTAQSVDDEVRQAAAAAAASERSARQVVVREPHNGVYDSLWRIADRELGDGARWPEIYRLNHGRPQADGRSLTDPDLIYPGWVLLLPDTAPTTSEEEDAEPDGSAGHENQPTITPPTPTTSPSEPSALPSNLTPVPSATTPADADPTETRPATTPPSTPTSADQPARPPGIDLGPGAFVGLGLAAAISTALLLARRRHRRWYQPGSGHRTDLPVAPVVRTLRIAHLQHGGPAGDRDPDEPGPRPGDPAGHTETVDPPLSSHHRSTRPTGLPVGVRDNHQVALDLARSRGLGLVGPGAPSAARALLLGILTTTETATTQVLIPQADAHRILEVHDRFGRWPSKLRVVPDLDAALDELEGDILHRARLAATAASTDPAHRLLVLIATPQPGADRRLQAVLDNGSTMGIIGILLDQWRPGATAHVRGDGTIGATNPGPAEQLRGTRLFTLPAPETTDLLALLHDADNTVTPQPDTVKEEAADPGTSEARPRASPPGADRVNTETHTVQEDHTGSRSAVELSWAILGTPRLTWHRHDTAHDLTTVLTPRQRELLVYLALHPDGVPRDTLAEALWPDGPAERPTNALHTALSRLRRTLHAASSDQAVSGLVTMRGDRYQLDPDLVDVDYWHLARAVAQSRTATTDDDRSTADRQIIAAYQGELAAGLHADWIEVPREAARRDAIDAAARLARALVDSDPQQTLHLLETARGFDPYNELIYRDIMRLQARLGQHDAISRTLTLLTTRLAELDEHPDSATVTLAAELQRRRPDPEHGEPQSRSRARAPR